MTGEKRCNECDWEFYKEDIDEFELENGTFKNMKCCPECGSNDIDYKLVGKEGSV